MVEIKTKCCGEVICSGETIRDAVVYAKQEGISLAYADLRHLNLRSLDLQGIDFRYADLSGADFRGAILTGTTFSFARVGGAKIDDENWRSLKRVNFQDLEGVWDFCY